MNDIKKFKQALINSGMFKRVNNVQYRTNCPFCMRDKGKHMYVKINTADDSPVVYYCFKDASHTGVVNKALLDLLGIDLKIPTKWGKSKSSKKSIEFDGKLVTETDNTDDITKYIQTRVGHIPTLDELNMFQYIGNPKEYAESCLNDISMNNLKNRYWFRTSNGNIIGRIHDDELSHIHWLKMGSQGIYSIKNVFDVTQQVNICVCEGIMDAIGIYYNVDIPNKVILACLGRNYEDAINFVIDMGIFGLSVVLNIFYDADVPDNQKMDKNHMLFKDTYVYQNTMSKDYGVPNEKLSLLKHKL